MTERPTYLFNCTTNVVGGAVQNAVNFVIEALRDPKRAWRFAVSGIVERELDKFGITAVGECFLKSPARDSDARSRLRSYARSSGAALVYTMAGPAYVGFDLPHVMGCSNPYLTNLDWIALKAGRGPASIASTVARTIYQAVHARRADYWIFQTEASKNGFCRRLLIDDRRTGVVPNAIGASFRSGGRSSANDSSHFISEPPRVLCPAAAYPHKLIHRIPEVIAEANRLDPDLKPVFTITIPESSPIARRTERSAYQLGVRTQLTNIGAFAYKDARQVYTATDVVFLPSLLEVFSTSYLEAMAMARPLVVPNRDFAKEICGDAAMYFNAASMTDAARKLVAVMRSPDLRQELVERGYQRLEKYGDSSGRYHRICAELDRFHSFHRGTEVWLAQ